MTRSVETQMDSYAITVQYTPEYRRDLIQNPSNRLAVVSPLVEKLGGKVKSAWLSQGPWDVLLIIELPSYTAASAITSVFQAGGVTSQVEMVPLMDITRWMYDVMKVGPTYFDYLRETKPK